jgi:hypothetical protein
LSITKFVLQAAMIAGAIGTSARGEAILTLGQFSSDSSSSAPGIGVPPSTGTSYNLALTDSTNQAVPAASPSTSTPLPSPSQTSQPPTYDALINFGTGPFPDAPSLTTGNAQAWYDSPNILGLFGGHPSAQQIGAFDSMVLQRVQQTFQLSGVPVALTDDPTASAAHSLSVVSNTVNPTIGGAIGMTYIGGNGFHFIDNSASYATSIDQLGWIVAHNVAHELMLAFGVTEVYDQTGKYIDSTAGQTSMFLNPNATFSPGAVQDLLSRDFKQANGSPTSPGAQLVEGAPVPEPATLASWGLGAIALIAVRRVRSRRASGWVDAKP